jgi:hypothetical protein
MCFLLLGRRQRHLIAVTFFLFVGVTTKKETVTSCCLLSIFSYLFVVAIAFLFHFFYLKRKKVLFYGPFATKKASSLELTINNDFVVFLMFRVVMGRGRRLKKVGGDLEA